MEKLISTPLKPSSASETVVGQPHDQFDNGPQTFYSSHTVKLGLSLVGGVKEIEVFAIICHRLEIHVVIILLIEGLTSSVLNVIDIGSVA